MAMPADEPEDGFRLRIVDDDGHADAHVEDLVKLTLGHTAARADQFKDRRQFPAPLVDHDVAIWRAAPAGCCPRTRRR
jgi:hypothetical protein